MRFKELRERLHNLGVDIHQSTLHGWAQAGLVTSPEYKPPRRRRGRPSGKQVKMRGPNYEWPKEAVCEAAACWAVKHLNPSGTDVPNKTLKRVKVLAEAFFKNVHAVDWREDFAPDGSVNTYFSSYDIHTLFVAYIAAYEKASDPRCKIKQHVMVKYYVVTKFNCRKDDFFEEFYPIIDVKLEKIDKDYDVLTWEYIEPWEYIDPETGKRYETTRDENGCTKFVKQPPPGERFLPYLILKST